MLFLQLLFGALPFGVDPGKRRGIPPDQDIEGQDIEQRKERESELVAVEHLALYAHPIQGHRNGEGRGQEATGHHTARGSANQGHYRFAGRAGAEQAEAEDEKLGRGVGHRRHETGNTVEQQHIVEITAHRQETGGRRRQYADLRQIGAAPYTHVDQNQGQAHQEKGKSRVGRHAITAQFEIKEIGVDASV